MKLAFNHNQDTYEIDIQSTPSSKNWQDLMNVTNRSLSCTLKINDNVYCSKKDDTARKGDDAIWIPFKENVGIKVFYENKRYANIESSLKTIENIYTLQQQRGDSVFPTIHKYGMVKDTISEKELIFIIMENLHNSIDIIIPQYVPARDRDYIKETLHTDSDIIYRTLRDLEQTELLPEDEWYKCRSNKSNAANLINGKIVDFHRFTKMPDRYYFKSNGKSKDELNKIYNLIVKRYQDHAHENNMKLPRWKGTMYQGFKFDNGYNMKGYSSAHGMYDSYVKLLFMPMNKIKGEKVLEIGSNQGFFCFQASIHGASKVTGIDLCKEDVATANDIKNIICLDNVNFMVGDAVKYVEEKKEKYGMIILNSVLHQIYPNFKDSEKFMNNISDSTDRLVFETPLNHPLMNIRAKDVEKHLKKYFKYVRLLNIYDAYSSGYRANFICFNV
jgi:hypothetical protein